MFNENELPRGKYGSVGERNFKNCKQQTNFLKGDAFCLYKGAEAIGVGYKTACAV